MGEPTSSVGGFVAAEGDSVGGTETDTGQHWLSTAWNSEHKSLLLGIEATDACIDPHDCPPLITIVGSGIPSRQNVQNLAGRGQHKISACFSVVQSSLPCSIVAASVFTVPQVLPPDWGSSKSRLSMPSSQNVHGSVMGSGQHTSWACWTDLHKGVNPFKDPALSFSEPHVLPCVPGISKLASIIPSLQNVHIFDMYAGVGWDEVGVTKSSDVGEYVGDVAIDDVGDVGIDVGVGPNVGVGVGFMSVVGGVCRQHKYSTFWIVAQRSVSFPSLPTSDFSSAHVFSVPSTTKLKPGSGIPPSQNKQGLSGGSGGGGQHELSGCCNIEQITESALSLIVNAFTSPQVAPPAFSGIESSSGMPSSQKVHGFAISFGQQTVSSFWMILQIALPLIWSAEISFTAPHVWPVGTVSIRSGMPPSQNTHVFDTDCVVGDEVTGTSAAVGGAVAATVDVWLVAMVGGGVAAMVDSSVGGKVVTARVGGGVVAATVGAGVVAGGGFGLGLNTNATSASSWAPSPNVKQFVMPFSGLAEFPTLGVDGSPFHTLPNK